MNPLMMLMLMGGGSMMSKLLPLMLLAPGMLGLGADTTGLATSEAGGLGQILPLMLMSGGRSMNPLAIMGLMTGNQTMTMLGIANGGTSRGYSNYRRRRRGRRYNPAMSALSWYAKGQMTNK